MDLQPTRHCSLRNEFVALTANRRRIESGSRTAVLAQEDFEADHGLMYLAQLTFQQAPDFRRDLLRERLLVFSARGFGIFAAPVDDAGVAHAHYNAEIHRGGIDQTRTPAGFLVGAAEARRCVCNSSAARLRASDDWLKNIAKYSSPTSSAA